MRGTLFLDTSGWFAAISGREAAHERARATYAEQMMMGGGMLVTTALVIAEMHVLLLKLRGPEAALKFLDSVAADPTHEVIDVDRDLRLAAIERWLRRALALDRHFAVAGYEVLPGP